MKRLFLLFAISMFIFTTGVAQKSNVSKAKNKALSVEAPDFKGAKEAIEEALVNEDTKNLANTLYIAGLVYEKSAENEFIKVQTGADGASEIAMGEDAIKAFNYYVEADKLDKMPDSKGKIKPKFTKKISASMLNMYTKMMFVNYAIKKYEAEEWQDAINSFTMHTDILNLPLLADQKDVPAKDSTYYQITYYAGMCAWGGELNDQAIAIYTSLKDKGYNENGVYQSLCQIYQGEKDTVNFVNTLLEGVDKFPSEFYFLGNLINHYVYSNQADKATGFLDKAIINDPTNPQLYNVKGSMLELQEDYEGAMENFNKAMELNPETADTWSNIGRLIYNKAFKAESEANAIRDFNLADIEIAKANEIFKESIQYFEKALELNPEDYDVMKTLRGLYYRFSDDDASYQTKYDEINERINN
ncbi:MAG: hypothetical protein R3Y59_09225 [bacterium]